MLSISTVPKTCCLASRDEEVARPDDLVDGFQTDRFEAIGQRRDPLGAADSINLGHSECVARGQDVGVETSKRGGGDDHGDLGHSGSLRGHNRHQKARRIGSRAAGYADPDPPNRPIQKAELDAVARGQHHVLMADRLLVRQDIAADATNGLEIGWIGLAMGVGQFARRNPYLLGLERHAVDSACVIEHSLEPACLDVGADSLDNLPRRQRLAKRRNRASFAFRADHISLGTELRAQRGDFPMGIRRGTINSPNLQ